MTVEALQNWVVQTGLMISILIVIILLIRRPFARMFGANAAYALWGLPLIRLCLPGLSVPESWVPKFLRQTPEQPISAPVSNLPAHPAPAAEAFIPAAPLQPEAIQWSIIILGAWLGIAVLWLGYQLFLQSRFKTKLTTQSSEPPADLLAEIERAAEKVGLSKTPIVRIGSNGMGPLVTGVLKPLIILPENFDQIFDAQQRHFALVHEFAHIKRRDLWVALATLVFRAVNWPNPLVHYASHKLRGDQEAACDAFVVKLTGGETAHSYAETLVKAAHQGRGRAKAKAHLALSLTQADSENSKGDEK